MFSETIHDTGLTAVKIFIDRKTEYSLDFTITNTQNSDLTWPTKVPKGRLLLDLRSLIFWRTHRTIVAGPLRFRGIVKRNIRELALLASSIGSLIPERDAYALCQDTRDFARALFTLDKCALLLPTLERESAAGIPPNKRHLIDFTELTPRDPFDHLQGFTPAKLKALSLGEAVISHRKEHQPKAVTSLVDNIWSKPQAPRPVFQRHVVPYFNNKPWSKFQNKQAPYNMSSNRGSNKFRPRPFNNKFQQPTSKVTTKLTTPLTCWNCDSVGHKAKDCKQPKKN